MIWKGDATVVELELRTLVRKQMKNASTDASGARPLDAGLRGEFESLRRKILYAAITNEIPGALRDLRGFFIDKGLVDRADFHRFFDRWLSSPFVALGAPVPNLLTPDEIRQLNEDLRGLNM